MHINPQLCYQRDILTLIALSICPVGEGNSSFPGTFKFGVGTSAYQVEGAWDLNGKSPNVWDSYTHIFPHKIKDGTNGDVACDAYHKTDEDVKNLVELGVDYYRFSISWSRLLPSGFSNKINEDGARYYNELIDKLLLNGIEPMVTLYHMDLPQALHEIGGWTSPYIADYFEDYARVCFELFGDRVKVWLTINEPIPVCNFGYGLGTLAPFYTSDGIGNYVCGHVQILAHTKAYRLYEREFKEKQKGKIGMAVGSPWYEPYTNNTQDICAAETANSFGLGWITNPVYSKTGDYPKVMRNNIDKRSIKQGFSKSRLPRFTREEVEEIRGSFDFLGLNHYTTYYARWRENCTSKLPSFEDDLCVEVFQDDSWESTAASFQKIVPWGLRKQLNWIKKKYDDVEVIITENGAAGNEDEGLEDEKRVKSLQGYLKAVLDAIVKDQCNVTRYTFWSYMDNFEWEFGYSFRYGLYHVDFSDPKKPRKMKKSARTYRDILETRSLPNIHFHNII